MKWFFIFFVSFLLIISKTQACQDPQDIADLKEAVSKLVAVSARSDKGYNKMLVRTLSCELPTIAGTPRLDVKLLHKNEHPSAFELNHPGRKLVGRANSPKGSPRDPSKLQQSMSVASETELSEEEGGSPIVITQRRATFSE